MYSTSFLAVDTILCILITNTNTVFAGGFHNYFYSRYFSCFYLDSPYSYIYTMPRYFDLLPTCYYSYIYTSHRYWMALANNIGWLDLPHNGNVSAYTDLWVSSFVYNWDNLFPYECIVAINNTGEERRKTCLDKIM